MPRKIEFLSVHNWDKHQSYRKDRPAPPWIKIYRSLLRDPKFIDLPDNDKLTLLMLWLVAADKNGKIPNNENTLSKIIPIEGPINLKLLKDKGFLDNHLATKRQPNDRLDTDTDTDKETDKKEIGKSYKFEGSVIRLNAEDFDRWTKVFSNLNLEAELMARDAWLKGQHPDVQQQWFVSTSAFLKNKDYEHKATGTASVTSTEDKITGMKHFQVKGKDYWKDGDGVVWTKRFDGELDRVSYAL